MVRAASIAILSLVLTGLALSTPPARAAKQGQAQVPQATKSAKPTALGVEQATAPPDRSHGSLDRPVKDKWALIVGISRFADSSINLKYADKDATDFYNFLIEKSNFAPDHVKLLLNENATRAQILSALGSKWLSRVANPDDLVVIYISTHGSPLDAMVGDLNYLVAHDTDKHDLLATGIAMQDIGRILKGRVHAERIALFLDACYSGTVAPEGKGIFRHGNVSVDQLVQGKGHLVISSSLPNQISWEAKDYANSVFTRRLIEGLSLNGRQTKLVDAFEHMKDQVQEEVLRDRAVLQSPVMKGKWHGNELVIAVPPQRPRPALKEQPAPSGITSQKHTPTESVPAPEPDPTNPQPATPQTTATQPSLAGQSASVTASAAPATLPQNQPLARPTTPVPSQPHFLPRKLVVFRARGSLPWKASNYVNRRYLNQDDVNAIPGKLSRALIEKLTPGAAIEVLDATGATSLEATGGNTDRSAVRGLGQSFQAKYLLDTIVNEFKFTLSLLTGNTYNISITATLVDGETGKPIWILDKHRVKEVTWVKDQVMGARGYVEQVLIPNLAQYIADKAVKQIARFEIEGTGLIETK